MHLKLERVSFGYSPEMLALRSVNLSISAGESVAIVGENGAGKSTLAKHLNGLLKPDEGRVLVGDWDTQRHSPAKLAARVGLAFQNPDDQLFDQTVAREVAFGPRNLGFSEERVAQQVAASLNSVGLVGVEDTHPYDLPLAQRKLVVIAAILAMDTPVVVLDEPTIGQDRKGIELVGGVVEDLKAAGRTVIVISHDLDFCAEHCRRVVVMARGQVQADGPAEDVLYQQALLKDAAVEPPQITRLSLALGKMATPLTVAAFVGTLGEKRENSQ